MNLKLLLIFLLLFGFATDAGAQTDWNNQGIVAWQTGNLLLARDHFEHALVENPEHAEACNNLALVLHALGDPFNAITFFFRALSIKPGFSHPRKSLEEILAKLEDVPLADAVELLLLIKAGSEKLHLEFLTNSIETTTVQILQKIIDSKSDETAILQKLLTNRELTLVETTLLLKKLKTGNVDLAKNLLKLASDNNNEPPRLSLVLVESALVAGDTLLFNRLRRNLQHFNNQDGELLKRANQLREIPLQPSGEMSEIIENIEGKRYYKAHLQMEKLKRQQGLTPLYRFLQGLWKFRQNERSGARRVLAGFDPLTVSDPVLLENAGILLARLDARKKALQCFERGCLLHPEHAEFFLNAGLIYQANKEMEKAEDYLYQALKKVPWSIKYKYYAWRILRINGETAAAEQLQKEILTAEPEGKYASGIRLEMGANPSDMLIVDASEILLHGSYEVTLTPQELQQIEKLALRNPRLVRPRKQLFFHWLREKNLEKTMLFHLLLREMKEEPGPLPWSLGNRYLSLGLYKEANHIFSEFTEVTPALKLRKQMVNWHLGKTTEAFLGFQELSTRFDDLITATTAARFIADAQQLKSVKLEDQQRVRLYLARQLLLYGGKKTAIQLLETAANLGECQAILLLAELLVEGRKPDEGLRLLEGFARKFGTNAELLSAMGEICFRVGSWQRGIKFLEESEKIDKLSVRQLIRRAEMKTKLKQNSSAILDLKLALTRTMSATVRGEITTRISNILKQ